MTSETASVSDTADELKDAVRDAGKAGKWTGVFLIIAGIAALVFPVVTTLIAEVFIGWLLIFVGLVRLWNSFSYQGTGPFFGAFLLGLATTAIGAFIIWHPLMGGIALTVLVAVAFIFDGAFETMLAFELKPEDGWGWMLFSGLIGGLAGILIAAGLPGTSLFVLGLLVGFNFLSSGIALFRIGRTVGKELKD